MVKPGPIIGLIIGIGLTVFPMMGFLMGEASLSDPKGKMIGFGFMIFGAIMVIINIIVLATGKENLLSLSGDTTTTTTTIVSPAPVKAKEEKVDEDDEEPEEKMIKCRYCKKKYSAEYNGCPYCKKK